MKLIATQKSIEALIAADERVKPLIDRFGAIEIVLEEDYFVSLASSIVGQQLSNKVADVIWNRLVNLLAGHAGDTSYLKARALREDTANQDLACINAQNFFAASEEELRSCGLSFNKIKYIKSLSSAVLEGTLPLEKFGEQSNEEIIAELVKIKGIGRWTAEMFLIFSLGREDIFSLGDIGLYNALCKMLSLEEMSKKEMIEFTDKFSPHRTLLSLYLWKSLDNEPK